MTKIEYLDKGFPKDYSERIKINLRVGHYILIKYVNKKIFKQS